MGFPILVRWHLCIEPAPWLLSIASSSAAMVLTLQNRWVPSLLLCTQWLLENIRNLWHPWNQTLFSGINIPTKYIIDRLYVAVNISCSHLISQLFLLINMIKARLTIPTQGFNSSNFLCTLLQGDWPFVRWIVLRKHKIYSDFFYNFSTLRWAIWLKSLHEEDRDHLSCRVKITASDVLAMPGHQQPWHWLYSGIFQSLTGLNNIFESLVVLQVTWPQNDSI